MIYVFTASYGMSFGPIAWVVRFPPHKVKYLRLIMTNLKLPNEIFPLTVRSHGVGLSTASNWFNNCRATAAVLWNCGLHTLVSKLL